LEDTYWMGSQHLLSSFSKLQVTCLSSACQGEIAPWYQRHFLIWWCGDCDPCHWMSNLSNWYVGKMKVWIFFGGHGPVSLALRVMPILCSQIWVPHQEIIDTTMKMGREKEILIRYPENCLGQVSFTKLCAPNWVGLISESPIPSSK
jgi:hypothetical protein